MPSTIGWLDQSEEQQRRMREVIALFAEPGTVDDIGIGVVRDAFSDLLFPGISTVQTRVRYFLLVPWVYQRLEHERIPSERAADKARQWELQLIHALKAGGESEGVIGRFAGDSLKQLPSFVYWNGLRALGIRHFAGTRSDLHRSMDRIHGDNRRAVRSESDEASQTARSRWHHNLPPAPDGLFEMASLQLSFDEARYLQERFIQETSPSLLAELLRAPAPIDDSLPYPWDAVQITALPAETARRVDYARWFSETIHGAQLLYNVMLGEQAADRGLAHGDERLERHQSALADWHGLIEARGPAIDAVDRREFWGLVHGTGARVSANAYAFVNGWLDLVVERTDVERSEEARRLIRTRERQLKKSLSRLSNPRQLENWGGASGSARLTFRWAQGRAAINDIAAGLGATDV